MIRYGIVGCGSMGREHIENIRALGGGKVTAVADPTPASRDAAAALTDGQVQLFDDHKDLLKSGLCDAVIVASPNFTHIGVMRDAHTHSMAVVPPPHGPGHGLDLHFARDEARRVGTDGSGRDRLHDPRETLRQPRAQHGCAHDSSWFR
jgi:threonine dehydrogenase-like Zn-dependent dehydrogenase